MIMSDLKIELYLYSFKPAEVVNEAEHLCIKNNKTFRREAELSADHHLVVCTVKRLKPLRKQKIFRPRKTY